MTRLSATKGLTALLLLVQSKAWVPRAITLTRLNTLKADDYPSDVDVESIDPRKVMDAEIVQTPENLKAALLQLGACTSRGESASVDEKETARNIVAQLEEINPTKDPAESCADITGTWELVFSDTQLFRSSPFFMAGRAVCSDGEEAKRYDWFCDMHRAALAISNIKRVRQIVSANRVVSEFEVSVGAVPFASSVPLPRAVKSYLGGGLPVVIEGAIVSSAEIVSKEGGAWKLLMDTVEIKGSNIPLLRQLLDGGLKLRTRDLGTFLESSKAAISSSGTYTNPTPKFETTYLDGQLRVSRDQDGKLFVYAKASPSEKPTDYGTIPADLGLRGLLGGLADSFIPQL